MKYTAVKDDAQIRDEFHIFDHVPAIMVCVTAAASQEDQKRKKSFFGGLPLLT